MSVDDKPYIAKDYWDKRYDKLSIDRSGHVDLPAEYNSWLYKRKRACIHGLLRKAGVSLSKARVLEMGAGTGVYVADWVKAGADVTGIDMSVKAAEALQIKYPDHKFFQADLTDPGLSSRLGPPYDLVTGIDVLYYLTDDTGWQRTLRMVHDALRLEGYFIIIEQFRHGDVRDHGYIKWRSLDAYTKVLTEAGFEIIDLVPAFFTMVQVCDTEPRALCAFLDRAWERTYPWMERIPKVMGPLAYAIDTILGTFLSEGPSMEVMLCRKTG